MKAFTVLPWEAGLEKTPAERSGLPEFVGGSQYPMWSLYQDGNNAYGRPPYGTMNAGPRFIAGP